MSTEQASATTALATQAGSNLPAHLQNLNEKYAGAGMEMVRVTDVTMPRLSLQQAMSPDVVEGKYKSGQIVCNITGEVLVDLGEKVEFIVLKHYLQWIKWRPRDEGGGIIASTMDPKHDLVHEMALENEKREQDKNFKPSIIEYHNFLLLLRLKDGTLKPYVLSCGKTNWKHGKALITKMKFRGPKLPCFAGLYTLSAETEENKNGQKYKVWGFENAGWAKPEDFALATQAYNDYAGKTIVVDQNETEGDAATGEFNEKSF